MHRPFVDRSLLKNADQPRIHNDSVGKEYLGQINPVKFTRNKVAEKLRLLQGSCCVDIPKLRFVFTGILTWIAVSVLFSQQMLVSDAVLRQKVQETLKKNAEMLRFMENKGQLKDSNILYYLESRNNAIYIERTKIRFVAKHYETIKKKFLEDETILKGTHTFTLNFEGGNPQALLHLGNCFSTRYNYFFGEDSGSWVSGVKAAKDLSLQEIYPGIGIRLYSNDNGSLEFDWILDKGADYHKINMLIEGQDVLAVDDKGSLNVGLRFTNVKFNIPESYQVTEQGKLPVEFAFHTDGKGRVNFTTQSAIDPKYPLVIDPVLTWGTFMDGNDPDFDQYLFAIQVDPNDGMVYCAGATNRQISTSSAPYDANGYLNAITGFGVSANPRVAIVYRINSGGSDLVDMTLYGPGNVAVSDQVVAYGLSLSTNRVYICGRTTVDLPMTGSPFDGTRNDNDGYVAVFSRDLGTLHYATYLGSAGVENLGATSIRAINDNTFVVGMTVTAALPGSYISGFAPDNTFAGLSEMYMARFTSYNSLQWGTYVGGSSEETFNDLEVFSDGRVAFGGWGNNTNGGLSDINSAAGESNLNDNTDGIIGVLNSSATGFNYLDEIGGAGNDRINDVEIYNGNLAFTGSVSDGFPTSSGAYDVTHNGELDVIVGTVSASGGVSSYRATFFGGGGKDIGAGIKKVAQYNCSGIEVSFLLVFGTTAENAVGIPTVNVNGESFYDDTNNGGLDIFFAGFNANVNTLSYATNIGGQYNDYLGDTGDPRGANHLWVKGGNIYVGTTTHSETHSPAIVGGGGFDQVKTNIANPTSDDTHILFSIEFSAIFETDYSDAPASYGTPSHILDCTHLRINNVDSEPGPIPGCAADGTDSILPDDEDGVSNFPTYSQGGPQNISITVNNILNTTGYDATLYAWIDANNDGQFTPNEFTSANVPNGFFGNRTITWTGITIGGMPTARIIRLRLTTNNLNDDPLTPVDDRAFVSASNGEVEDYALCEKPDAGFDKYVNCITLPGGSSTMTANSTGNWTAQSSNPGSATITNPGSPSTTITNFSTDGTYNFIWSNNCNCARDTVSIFVSTFPNAGSDKSLNCVALPGGSIAMTATGTGTWSAGSSNPGTATITNPSSPTTTITNFSASGSYVFIWTNASSCPDTTRITITAKPNAGANQNVNCVLSFPGGSATMSASGTGSWSAQSGNPGTASIANPASPTTTITNFSTYGNYRFIWTAVNGCTDTVMITVTQAPSGSASAQTICSGSATNIILNSSVAGSSFTWTASQFSGESITGFSNCSASCGSTIIQTLNNTSNNNPGVVRYTVTPIAPNGCNGNPFTVDVTVNPRPQGSASAQTICSGATTSINLNTTIPGTAFTWTATLFSGSTITGFSNCNSSCGNSIIQTLTNTSNSLPGIVRYTITPVSPAACTGSSFTVDVTVNPLPSGTATSQSICSETGSGITLNSTIASTSFTWTASQFSGSAISGFSSCNISCGTAISQTLINSTNTAPGVVRYTITPASPAGCTGSSFTAYVTVNPKPVTTPSATPACIGLSNGTASANASAGMTPYSYIWSNGLTSSSISNLAAATYPLTITDANGCTDTGSTVVLSSGITGISAVTGICESLSNTYPLTGVITFQNPPSSGTLTVSADGRQQVFNAPFTSPLSFSLTGLSADSSWHVVSAVFSGGANCSATANFFSPPNCWPRIYHSKSFVSYTRTAINTYDVIYRITVMNDGGFGYYDLRDVPAFDDDITINNVSYTSNAPGNPGGSLSGSGPWLLANNQAIAAKSSSIYTVRVNVTINLETGSGGDNVYKKCGQTIPGNPVTGEGLFNQSLLDTNDDGVTDESSKTCGDLPYVTHQKTLVNVVSLGNHKYQANYQIIVSNTGGASSQYDLTDAPAFDNDITINSASYTSNVSGNPGAMLTGLGPWTLANDQNIAAGVSHTYQLSIQLTLDLNPASGGDNVYKKCGQASAGNPVAGEGLYNNSRIDTNNDGIADESDDACGDLPYVTHEKFFVSAVSSGSYQFDLSYRIEVRNLGGVNGQYDLFDQPGFDDDISILNASYTSNAAGNPGTNLSGSGPWTLANDQAILPGDKQVYQLFVKVIYDSSPSSGGDNVYHKCGYTNISQPKSGEGLFNESRMDINNDGIFEVKDDACGDLPDIAKYGSTIWHDKNTNGQRDIGETGIQGVTVILYDAATKTEVANKVTDAMGKYLFENLKARSYYAKYSIPSGYFLTNANIGSDLSDSDIDGSNGPNTNATIILDHGDSKLTNDGGMVKCAIISGYIWLDSDMDGVMDPEEKGINGMNVYLVDAATGAVVMTVKTKVKPGTVSNDGYYFYDCVKPGNYYLKFERPQHLAATPSYQTGGSNKNNYITHENGINTTRSFTLYSGDTLSFMYGGFQVKSQVGDKVWIDQNFNGIQDSEELPLPSVKVTAYNLLGTKVSEAQSGTDGKFILDGLADGMYYVRFELPNQKYNFTKARAAGDDEKDSDVEGINGYGSTRLFSIFAGEIRSTIDAGVVSQALALEWLNFTGNYNGNFTELNWSTLYDPNNDSFVIERRYEKETEFHEIQTLQANMDENKSIHKYEYDDFDVMISGTYYYRIKQIDKDKAFTFSNIIAVRTQDEGQDLNLMLYPNPVVEMMKIELWIPDDTQIEAKVYDPSGRIVMIESFNKFLGKGRHQEILQTGKLLPGQYVLEISTSNGLMRKKFTVLH